MSSANGAVVFVWPGDLHLIKPDMENHRTALWMADEVKSFIKPDFVQFAGDNAQDATDEQFQMFRDIAARLDTPSYALVGDHDVHHDPQAHAFRTHVGETYGSMALRGYRFIRLNTMEFRPLGLSREQVLWFRFEVDRAVARGEKIVVFQHHYPFQIWEDFDGPGIDEWREVVQTRRITAIFAGHTHYGQVANDGRNVSIASRSIGDPEGGPPGYSIVYLHGDDFAVKYRSTEDRGPAVMITHPRDSLLALSPRHIVAGQDRIGARIWCAGQVSGVEARVGDGNWFKLEAQGSQDWGGELPTEKFKKGEHALEVRARGADGQMASDRITFMLDRTGRFTAVPCVRPMVTQTAFC
jgi:3',5'-cyclic AMP phosphodiesterase CpdA